MANAGIDRGWPPPPAALLDDERLSAAYAVDDRSRQSVRLNFVSSIDGAATAGGLSAGLSSSADKRVFDLLRRLCDVVLVGAGTVRAEGYGAMRLDEASVQWRRANGLAPQPVFAIVSGALHLDPGSAVFTEAPVRPVVVTVGASASANREALSRVADVLVCGAERLEVRAMLGELAKRGLRQVLCEGGPRLFGTLLEAACLKNQITHRHAFTVRDLSALPYCAGDRDITRRPELGDGEHADLIVLMERHVADHAARSIGQHRVKLRAGRIGIEAGDQNLSEIRVGLHTAGGTERLGHCHSRRKAERAGLPYVARYRDPVTNALVDLEDSDHIAGKKRNAGSAGVTRKRR